MNRDIAVLGASLSRIGFDLDGISDEDGHGVMQVKRV